MERVSAATLPPGYSFEWTGTALQEKLAGGRTGIVLGLAILFAYLFLVAEAMVEAGVLAGLPHDIAETLTFQTLLGSSRLLTDGGSTPAALRASVTSPGGTTAAGVRELERARETRHHGHDFRLRHRKADFAHIEERMAECINLFTVAIGDGPGGSDRVIAARKLDGYRRPGC